MLEPAGSSLPFPRAFLRVGGASLAQHQLGLALALDCQRVICLARGTSPELTAVQHAAESAGIRFHTVSGPQQISSLVTATDELIVITEGLFVEPDAVVPLLEGTRPMVMALPDDGAVAEGFERLDINHAAAGIMRIPGSLIERLHDLPPDCDAASALTRIALQSGVRMQVVPAETRVVASWRMVRSEAEALALETEWLRKRLNARPPAAPADRLARMGVVSFGSSLLHAGNASGAASIGTLVALFLALGTAWLGTFSIAFAFAALGWVLVKATEMLRSAERQAYGAATPAIPRAEALGWLVDIALIVICVLALAGPSWMPPIPLEQRLFAPVMLMLLVHLAPRFLLDGLAVWTCDRTVLALLLGLAAVTGNLGTVVRLLAVALAFAGTLTPARRLS